MSRVMSNHSTPVIHRSTCQSRLSEKNQLLLKCLHHVGIHQKSDLESSDIGEKIERFVQLACHTQKLKEYLFKTEVCKMTDRLVISFTKVLPLVSVILDNQCHKKESPVRLVQSK